jgi:hypothetical protein
MKFLRDIARIWNAFVERILYILDPLKQDEEKEYLKMQIEIARNERLRILEMLSPQKEEDETLDSIRHEPINQYIPWRVRRAQLELEHRIKKPEVQSKIQQDIENLEKELEITND